MEKCAVISDIHGNVTALQEVLYDIESRGITKVVCLGDLVGKGPQPGKAVDLCQNQCAVVVKGNWDDFISVENSSITGNHISWIRESLGASRLEYLRSLPACFEFSMGGRDVRLFHSSSTGIHHRVHMNSENDNHVAMFENTEFTGHGFCPDVVGYGDIHVAYLKNLGGKVLFNAGSVGNPLDINQASYVILEETKRPNTMSSLQMSFVRVSYDIGLEVRIAQASGMPDSEHYIHEITTGKYRGKRT